VRSESDFNAARSSNGWLRLRGRSPNRRASLNGAPLAQGVSRETAGTRARPAMAARRRSLLKRLRSIALRPVA